MTSFDAKTFDYLEINIFHVGGGGGGIGPADVLFELEGVKVNLYLFELRQNENSGEIVTNLGIRGNIQTFLVSIGVAESSKRMFFNVNKYPLSSSIYPPSPLVMDECPNFGIEIAGKSVICTSWKQNTELDKKIEFEFQSLDYLIEAQIVPRPDFLSMDIQGSELSALLGARNALEKDILGVTTETEFYEIYLNQPLFQDQAQFLEEFSFRLMEVPGFQMWFPGPAIGKGFATVAEPTFLKMCQEINGKEYGRRRPASLDKMENQKIFKLALIAFAFRRYSYFFTLIKYLQNNRAEFYLKIVSDKGLTRYLQTYELILSKLPLPTNKPTLLLDNPPQLSKSNMGLFYKFVGRIFKLFKVYHMVQKIDIETNKGKYLKY